MLKRLKIYLRTLAARPAFVGRLPVQLLERPQLELLVLFRRSDFSQLQVSRFHLESWDQMRELTILKLGRKFSLATHLLASKRLVWESGSRFYAAWLFGLRFSLPTAASKRTSTVDSLNYCTVSVTSLSSLFQNTNKQETPILNMNIYSISLWITLFKKEECWSSRILVRLIWGFIWWLEISCYSWIYES